MGMMASTQHMFGPTKDVEFAPDPTDPTLGFKISDSTLAQGMPAESFDETLVLRLLCRGSWAGDHGPGPKGHPLVISES